MFLDPSARWQSMGLIDLDGSYFVQLGIFLVFLLVMNFLLFKPLLRVLDERRRRTEGARDEAREQDTEAKGLVVRYESKLAEAMARGADLRAELRATATAEAGRSVAEARGRFDEQIASGSAKARSEYEAATAGVDSAARPLAEAIAARLLDTSRKA